MESNEIRVGTVVKPHGVEGTVVVEILTDFPEQRFSEGNNLRLLTDSGREQYTVESGSPHQQRWLLTLREVNDRDQAEALRGADIVIEEDEVIGEEGDLYDFDLVGMDVYNQHDESVGTIREVEQGSDISSLRIELEDGGIAGFPAHEELILDSDRHEGWIQLRFQEGWEKLIDD